MIYQRIYHLYNNILDFSYPLLTYIFHILFKAERYTPIIDFMGYLIYNFFIKMSEKSCGENSFLTGGNNGNSYCWSKLGR